MFALGNQAGIHVAPAVAALLWAVAALAVLTLIDYARRAARSY